MEWIEVSKKPPGKTFKIIAYEEENERYAVLEWIEDGWDGSHWYLTLDDSHHMDDFTLWMPLPRLPGS